MPVYIQCSSCNRKLRVRPEFFGKTVRCPGCGARFIADPAESQAPPSGAAGGTAEADEPESVLPTSQPEKPDESSDPTVRRPIPPSPAEGPAAAAPSARQAITARPPQEAGEPRADAAGGRSPGDTPPDPHGFETPWARVGLVLGLILLAVVLLGLAGALWVNAGIRAAQRKQADAVRPRPALAVVGLPPGSPGSQPGAAGTGRFRPRSSARSPLRSRSRV
jgi:hypothetical protein